MKSTNVWDDRKQYIIEQIAGGRKMGSIALEFGVSGARLTVVCQRMGIDKKTIKHAGWATRDHLEFLVYEQGYSVSAIASEKGVTPETAQEYLAKFDINPRDPIVRFESRCQPGENGCIDWTGSNTNGYGRFHDPENPDGTTYAYRWIYEQKVGPIPDGMTIDHICNNPSCVNTGHLEVVTQSVNSLRMIERRRAAGLYLGAPRKTHCKRGHEYTDENTYLNKLPSGGTTRSCRDCISARVVEKMTK